MNKGFFHRVTAQTPTRFWINNVTRKEADIAIEAGAVGCTQNPAYVWKMLSHPEEKDYAISFVDAAIQETTSDDEVLLKVQRSLVAEIAKKFFPIYEKSGGKNGYVSIQGNPLKEDADTIIREARFNRKGGANIMAKIPAIVEGLEAIETLLAEGTPINATEVMAVRQALDVASVYNKVCTNKKDIPRCYYSHISGIYDQYLQEYVKKENIDISPDSLWQAGIILAKKSWHMTKAIAPQLGFIGGGARGLHHFTEMIGADAVVTINWKGTAENLIEQNPPVVQRFFMTHPDAVIDELTEKLTDFQRGYFVHGIKPHEYEDFGPVVLFRNSFVEAWNNALDFIANRRKKLK